LSSTNSISGNNFASSLLVELDFGSSSSIWISSPFSDGVDSESIDVDASWLACDTSIELSSFPME